MNLHQLTLESFLEKNRVSKCDWGKADINFDELKLIAIDHQQSTPSLYEAAEFLAKILQRCVTVHSVRWRVKHPEHLMEKIVRKRAEGNEKYSLIGTTNYMEIVTDLVGVRVLHLFKHEWKDINDYIINNWKPIEYPIAYIRSGDEGDIIDSYKESNCDVKEHPAGYRSIHYLISTQPTLRKVISEIQVRTIFEEGWSEIDHKIRYPNFSDNQLISYFLTIFNRMAGSADEMGSFVKNLTTEIAFQELRFAEISREQEKHLSEIEKLASELANEKKQGENKDSKLEKLNEEIRKLRSNSDNYSPTTSSIEDNIKSRAQTVTDIIKKNKLTDDIYPRNIAAIHGMLSPSEITGAKLAAMDGNILGHSAAARFAAMNENILGNSVAAKLAAMNENILGNSVAAKLAAIKRVQNDLLEKNYKQISKNNDNEDPSGEQT